MSERPGSKAKSGGWRVVGASAPGSAHVARGLPCQDAWSWRQLADGRLALVVCDGAGSAAARAELGAATAADAWIAALESADLASEVVEEMTRNSPESDDAQATAERKATATDWRDEVIPFDEPAPKDSAPNQAPSDQDSVSSSGSDSPALASSLEDGCAGEDEPRSLRSESEVADPELAELAAAVSLARKALAGIASDEGRPLRDFACTLSGLVVSGDRLLSVQVGDSVAVARDPKGGWHTVGQPQKDGEYANEAHFLTADDALTRMEVRAFDFVPKALVSASDGLLRLMLRLPTMEPHAPFVEPLLRFVAAAPSAGGAADRLAAFLASSKVRARTDDDTTLLIALREPELPSPAPIESGADALAVDPGS